MTIMYVCAEYIFLLLAGTMWMNWALFGFTVVCIPMIALIKGRFNRLEVDEGVNPEVYVEQEVEVAHDYTVQGVD